MAHHPIHQATENSLFGDLTRDEFYKKHRILHHQEFIIIPTRRNTTTRIYTQTWRLDSPARPKALLAMIHGYNSDSSSLLQLTAVAFAKLGFHVCALDLPGHGLSDGPRGHIPDIRPVLDECALVFDSARAAHPKLPAFLYGESLGGAISILLCLRQQAAWRGLVLNGAMCGISAKLKPPWPLEMLLPLAGFLAPTWRVVPKKRLGSRSFKEGWVQNLARKCSTSSGKRAGSSRPPASTAAELMRVCGEIGRRCGELEIPMLVVHGERDWVCSAESARKVFEMARSRDKTLKIFPGMWHMLIGEPKEGVELAFGTIFSWLIDRTS
ncbi:hypothetical protein ACLOJK_021456 [Asimina triloba]